MYTNIKINSFMDLLKFTSILLVLGIGFIAFVLLSLKVNTIIASIVLKYFYARNNMMVTLPSLSAVLTLVYALIFLSILMNTIFLLLEFRSFYPNYSKTIKKMLLSLLLLVLLTIMICNNYIKINDKGIFYNKLFSITEKHYSWDDIDNIEIYLKYHSGKYDRGIKGHIDLNIRNGKKIDVWQWPGLGSPDNEKILNFIKYASEQKNIVIYINDKFDREIITELNKNANNRAMNSFSLFVNLQNKNIIIN